MIIAIDPSLTATAVIVGDAAGYRIETFKCPRVDDTVRGRVDGYSRTIRSIIDWIGRDLPETTKVLIEGYAYSTNGKGKSSTYEFGGVLRFRLCGLPYEPPIEISPSSLKKFATGRGGTDVSKNMVGAHLTKRYDVLLNSDDEYDAYALYRIGLVLAGLDEPQTTEQRATIEAIRRPPAPKPRKKK